MTIIVLSGSMFGFTIGYITWHAIRPGEQGVSLKTVSAFIAIVIGAAITSLFPAGSDIFAGYCIGLTLGFFFTPISRWLAKIIAAVWNTSLKLGEDEGLLIRTEARSFPEELKTIKKTWSKIDPFLAHALNNSKENITIKDLEALPYSFSGKVSIMQRYAQEHFDDGVFFVHDVKGPRLYKSGQSQTIQENKSSNE